MIFGIDSVQSLVCCSFYIRKKTKADNNSSNEWKCDEDKMMVGLTKFWSDKGTERIKMKL